MRTAGAARVWRYQGRECAVEIYFYYDTGQADFFALEQRLDRGKPPKLERELVAIRSEDCLAVEISQR